MLISQPELLTERLLLRPFSLEDASKVQVLAGDKRISDMTSNIPYPYPEGAAEQWIIGHRPGWEEGTQASYAITDAVTKDLYGAIGLNIKTTGEGLTEAELGYWLGVDYWGQGLVTEACLRVVKFGLNDLNLDRIHARRLSHNPASGRVLEKAGLIYTGTAEGSCGDKFSSIDYYEILKP